jgi:hypothetical protein
MTYALSPQRSHIETLGDKALLYKGRNDLEKLLLEFDRQWQHEKNWDTYSKDFSPQAIMPKFDQVFIKGKNFDPKSIRLLDNLAIEGSRFQRKIRNLSKKCYL